MQLKDDPNRDECLRLFERLIEAANAVLKSTDYLRYSSENEHLLRGVISLRMEVEQSTHYLGYTPTPAADIGKLLARSIAEQIEAGGNQPRD